MKILKINLFAFTFLVMMIPELMAQVTKDKSSDADVKDRKKSEKILPEKKWRIGGMYMNSWTSLPGYNTEKTFYKPSLGGMLYAEYTFIPWVGIGMGFGLTQRGAGIKYTHVIQPGLGDVDSTYRTRVRSNNIILPLGLVIKAPLWKGARFSFFGGGAFNYAFSGERVYLDVESGFHSRTSQTELYKKVDFLLHASAGLDIQAGSPAAVLRVHFLFNEGLRRVYRGSLSEPYSGKNSLFGIQLGVLF
jgi:hypothetical protein